MGMVQSRATLLEQAIARACGGHRQLVLESHNGTITPASTPASSASPTPSQKSASSHEAAEPAAMPSPATQTTAAAMPPVLATPGPVIRPAEAVSTEPAQTKSVQASQPMPSPIDDKVKRFTEFFNGQVVDLDGSD
jgi:DNA polymerase-3 subunit gamma/tau